MLVSPLIRVVLRHLRDGKFRAEQCSDLPCPREIGLAQGDEEGTYDRHRHMLRYASPFRNFHCGCSLGAFDTRRTEFLSEGGEFKNPENSIIE